MNTITIFCVSDNFYRGFEPRWKQHLSESWLKKQHQWRGGCLSEVMTIMVGFHLSGYRTFEHDYLNYVLRYQRGYFPRSMSYNRFGRCSGISFTGSNKISVCHDHRIGSHQVMAEFAARERPVWVDFMGSSYTWSSMTNENC
jgi:hypothetical protein